jgi:hypothetical protein
VLGIFQDAWDRVSKAAENASDTKKNVYKIDGTEARQIT